MSEQVLIVLISAGAGLLAAIIGFAGLQRANQRTVAQAQEQRQRERAQEMRAEAIPKIFEHFDAMQKQFAFVLDLPHRGSEQLRAIWREDLVAPHEEPQRARIREWNKEQQSQTEEFVKQLDEFRKYLALHRIWIPENLATLADELSAKYDEHNDKWYRALQEWGMSLRHSHFGFKDMQDIDEALNPPLDLYEAQIRETRDWFGGERLRQEAALASVARKVLAVKE
jgi:hypothetical protein